MKIIKISLLFLATLFIANLEAYTHKFNNNTGLNLWLHVRYTSGLCRDDKFSLPHGAAPKSISAGLCDLNSVQVRMDNENGKILFDSKEIIKDITKDTGLEVKFRPAPSFHRGSGSWNIDVISYTPPRIKFTRME